MTDETEYKEKLFSLFPAITDAEKDAVRPRTVIRSLPKGRFIYRENEWPKGFVCLLEGNAKVVKRGINGRGQIIRLERPMGILGYRALFAEENYRSSAVSLDDSVIALVEREVFFTLLRSNAEISLNILKSIACELGISNLRTLSLTQKYIRGRLADALLFLIATYGFAEDGKTIAVTLSREDLAQLSSMNTSNAIRTLSAFAADGAVELTGKRIRIRDMELLKKISLLG